MPTDHRAMGPAMLGRRHVQPARGHRRQWRPQQNHYQRRGNEFEPPRHILNDTTGAVPARAVTEITGACNRDYKPARQRRSRSIVLLAENVTDAGFLSRLTGHFTDGF